MADGSNNFMAFPGNYARNEVEQKSIAERRDCVETLGSPLPLFMDVVLSF